jgi:hypothetical protein
MSMGKVSRLCSSHAWQALAELTGYAQIEDIEGVSDVSEPCGSIALPAVDSYVGLMPPT